jgi:hypothetical protein
VVGIEAAGTAVPFPGSNHHSHHIEENILQMAGKNTGHRNKWPLSKQEALPTSVQTMQELSHKIVRVFFVPARENQFKTFEPISIL